MRTFSPSEAAFEGFRVIREHPGAVLAWAVASVILHFTFGALALALLGPQIATLSHYGAVGSTMPPGAATSFIGSAGLFILLAIPLALFLGAIFINAVYRPILRPQDRGLFYLKLGGDEGRMVLLFLALFGLGILAEIVVVIGAVLLALVLRMGVAAMNGPQFLTHLILILALICLVIWVLVRMSLAAPMTFATRKLSVFSAWGATKGRFWSLLGCYILAWIFGILIALVGWVVSISAAAVVTGDWTALSGAMVDPRAALMASGLGSFAHLLTLSVIVQVVLSSLMGSISRVIMYAPMAAAYRDLTAPKEPLTGMGEAPLSDTPPGVLIL